MHPQMCRPCLVSGCLCRSLTLSTIEHGLRHSNILLLHSYCHLTCNIKPVVFDEHWILSRLSAILELKTGNFEAEEGSFYVIDLQFYVIEQMIAIEIGIFIHPSRIYYQYKRGQWISSGDCKQSKEPPSKNYISYEQAKTWDLKH